MRRFVLCLAAAALMGCGTTAAQDAPPGGGASGPARLGGVDLGQPLRALGTEPFWGVDISGDEMTFSGADRPTIRAAPARRTVFPDSVVYRGLTESGVELVVTLEAQDCSDGMSDRTYPLTARVTFGDDIRLSGCAASKAAIMSAGESGRVGG